MPGARFIYKRLISEWHSNKYVIRQNKVRRWRTRRANNFSRSLSSISTIQSFVNRESLNYNSNDNSCQQKSDDYLAGETLRDEASTSSGIATVVVTIIMKDTCI